MKFYSVSSDSVISSACVNYAKYGDLRLFLFELNYVLFDSQITSKNANKGEGCVKMLRTEVFVKRSNSGFPAYFPNISLILRSRCFIAVKTLS